MMHLVRPTSSRRASIHGAAFILVALLAFATQARAQIDDSVTKTIWKMRYQVPEAKAADPNWLQLDDDGDGISNGAEIAAGTNPFKADSTIRVTSMVLNVSGDAEFSFPTIANKKYLLQSNGNLSDPAGWADVTGKSLVATTDGATQMLSVTPTPNTFYRIRVTDLDTDGDQVSDWAEKLAGYNPNSAMTDGRTADKTAITAAAASFNRVTVSATKMSATQPKDSLTVPSETGSITVSRGIAKLGSIVAPDISVPIQRAGTAIEGTDYDTLSTMDPVTFTTGISQVVLPINPRANAGLRTNVTAIVNAVSGTGYTVASPAGASVVINPAGNTDGTGLTGRYYSTASSNYTTQANIFAANTPAMTRVDSTIDFSGIASISTANPCTVTMTKAHGLVTGNSVTIAAVSGGTFSPTINGTFTATVTGPTTFTVPSNCTGLPTSLLLAYVSGTNGPGGWGSAAGPAGMSTAATAGLFSVRWTGQVLPQYTENYYFDLQSDDSAKIWVNGKLLVDRWASQGATEYANSIQLKAGILYDIQIDYWNQSGTAMARLMWWSSSQPKQLIPQGRLFPAPASMAGKFTAITNSLVAIGYVGTPFSFNLTTPDIGGAITFALTDSVNSPLPAGLALNSATGAITGTPTTPGIFNVPISATNVASGAVTGSSVVNFKIFPAGGVTREVSQGGMAGAKVSDLLFPPDTVLANAANHDTIATIDDDADYGPNTGERLRGYLIPPKTGNYYFWLSGNNAAELWISNDAEPVNRVRRAFISGGTAKKTWADPANTTSQQQSAWLALSGGEKYYFEVLHNTGSDSDDHLAVGWCQDDIGTVPAAVGSPNSTGATPVIPVGDGPLQGYPLSGRVPGYIFQPYDYPPTVVSNGTLYSANLGPQGSSATKASGSANLRVDPSGTSAVLHFTYGGLTSPRTAYHLHTDSFLSHPQGEIIFDIDDIDSFHPELRTADGGYIWNFGAVGSFTSAAQILDGIQRGKIYLNVHSVIFPSGEIRGNLGLVDGSQSAPNPALYAEPSSGLDSSTNTANVARFLNQASFGAHPTDIAYVKANGFSGWIDNQLTLPASHISDDVVNGVTADINSPYPSRLFTDTWWKYAVTGQSQLRQRLAFALSEILVVSWANDTGPLSNNGRILADYYDQLVDYCLPTPGLTDSGNFRGILKAVTLTPAMGLYLDMRGNQKGDDSIGRHPNENYGREILQLFSVGLNRAWDDGRFVLDSNANLLPTYTQANILGYAALLTGWNYAQANQGSGRLPSNFGPTADYLNPMVLVPTQHDLGAKLLLNNVVVPAATGLTPRVSISSVTAGSPSCAVNTSTAHGLKPGDTIRIANVSGGTFVPAGGINASLQVSSVLSSTSFTVPIACSSTSGLTYSNAIVTGATVLSPNTGTAGTSPLTPITGSQSDNSGTTLPHPYDQYGLNELDRAMDNIVNNDNVPPYICRQLIQRLVTSAPSPGYLFRVVQTFKNNGAGVRGDLAAVVRRILLDGEARSSSSAAASATFGKQREPILRLTGPARSFPATAYTGTYTQLSGVDSNKLRIVTSASNGFNSGFTVSLDFKGNYTSVVPPTPFTNPTSTTYNIVSTLGIAKTSIDVASIEATSPCRIHTVEAHGLSTGNSVVVSGVAGGSFSAPLTTQRSITYVDANTFDVSGVNCTVVPTNVASAKLVSNPCRVTTVQAHGLTTGDTVTIASVSGGAFNPTINGTFVVTVVDPSAFTIGSNCTSPGTVNTGNIVGANTLDVAATGMANATYSQAAGTSLLTVNTAGPQTNIPVPGSAVGIAGVATGNPCVVTTTGSHNLVSGGLVTITNIADGGFDTPINGTFVPTVIGPNSFTVPVNCTAAASSGTSTKLIRSRVYLKFLTQTAAGGAAIATDGVYDVLSVPTGSSFTVSTLDIPATSRSGNALVPKFSTSYSPLVSNTVVQFNNNVNHNLQLGQNVWVDVPVIGTPVADAEYKITEIVDEDHFKTSYLPDNLNGGVYPKPSGSSNGVTIYPLVPPPLSRSGVVTINQSTFSLGSTESTLAQSPLNSPTVFNFFFPNYKFPGSLANSGLDSPEFQLSTDTNLSNITNTLTNMFIGTGGANANANGLSSFNNGGGSVVMDIGGYMTVARAGEAGIPALVDELAALLTGGTLESGTRATIIAFINHKNTSNTLDYFPLSATPSNIQLRDRVRGIIHLILTSAEYAVQK